MSRADFAKQLHRFMNRYDRFLLSGHIRPDGDSVGVCTALGLALMDMGKEVRIVFDGDPSRYTKIVDHVPALPEDVEVKDAGSCFESGNSFAFIMMDCSEPERTGRAAEAIMAAEASLCIDHHVTSKENADFNYVESETFTPAVLEAIDRKGIERNEITLHVGAGTFKPVKSEEIGGHAMHAEWVAVQRESIERLLAHGGKCVAVGTTSVRTLESLYYVGVMLARHPEATQDDLHVPQWLPYEYAAEAGPKLSTCEALQNILDYLDRNALPVLHTSTQIIIAPGYRYHIVRAIVTNFHQPQSTLLLLVSAFVGEDWKNIYRYALDHDFRFLSYGDSSLLFPKQA